MSEKPMIFSETIPAIKNTKPDVWPAEAIDPGKPYKWMTRRIVNRINGGVSITEFGKSDAPGYDWHFRDKHLRWHDVNYIIPPYQKGDILWARETFQIYPATEFFKAENGPIKPYEKIPKTKPEIYYIEYAADNEGTKDRKYRSPLYLPRWASRFTLKVRSVRVERLQDISADDCRAEGTEGTGPGELLFNYSKLWDSINAKRGYPWDKNPWVEVIEFIRLS
jgi:hypothetical protein